MQWLCVPRRRQFTTLLLFFCLLRINRVILKGAFPFCFSPSTQLCQTCTSFTGRKKPMPCYLVPLEEWPEPLFFPPFQTLLVPGHGFPTPLCSGWCCLDTEKLGSPVVGSMFSESCSGYGAMLYHPSSGLRTHISRFPWSAMDLSFLCLGP